MDISSLIKVLKDLLITNGGLAIVIIIIHIIMHKNEHKNLVKYFSHTCTQKDLLTDIKEKIDKYVWKFESEDAKKRQELIDYLKEDNEMIIQKMLVDLREFIRIQHDFEKETEEYALLLYNKMIEIWAEIRKERPLNLDVAEIEKLQNINHYTLPVAKVLMWDLSKHLLDPALNGTRETTIDSCLIKGLNYFQGLWKDLLEKEFR